MKKFLLAAAIVSYICGHTAAATYYWDQDATAAGNSSVTGAGLGGSGSWTTDVAQPNRWWDGVSTNVDWTNGGNDAVFWGTPGTVTLAASPNTPTAASLSFKTAYTLTAQTLDVVGSMAINVDAGVTGININPLLTASSGETLSYNGNVTGSTTIGGANTGFDGEFKLNSGIVVPGDTGGRTFGATTNTNAKLSINGGALSSGSNIVRVLQVLTVDINGDFAYSPTGVAGNNPTVELRGGGSATAGTAVITLKTANPTITTGAVGNGALILGGVIGQSAAGYGFTKDGAGLLTLTNPANSYTGATTIKAGQLRVDADATLGNGTGTLYLSGGKLNIITGGRAASAPIANPIEITADSSIVTTNNSATVDLNLSGTLSGSAGTLTFKNEFATAGTTLFDPHLSGSGFTFSRPVVIDNGVDLTNVGFFNASGTQTFTGVISGNGSVSRSASSGTGGDTVLSGANTYSGGTTLNSGYLGLGSSTVGTITSGPIGTGGLKIGTGSAGKGLYADSAAQTASNPVTFSSATNSSVEIKGTKKLTLSGTIDLSAGTRTFNTTNTADTVFSGVVSNGTLVKSGAGVLVLENNNTYSGGTTISNGTLLANNTTGSATGSGSVTVGSGATLGGSGAVAGAVTVQSGGTLSPGNSIESLGSGSVTFNSGATFKYEVNTIANTADLLNAMGGSLSIASGVTLTPIDLNPNPNAISGPTYKYTMIAYDNGGNPSYDPGTFSGYAELSIVTFSPGGKEFRIRYKDTSPGGNFASELSGAPASTRYVTLTAVPELSSFLIMGLIGCCLMSGNWVCRRLGIRTPCILS